MRRSMAAVHVVIAMAIIVSGCDRLASRITDEALRNADEAGRSGQIGTARDTKLPAELTIRVPAGYELISASRIDVGDDTHVSVSLRYPDSDLERLVGHFDETFPEEAVAYRSDSSSEGIRSLSWATTDYSAAVSVTSFEDGGFLGVGVTQVVPRH